MHFNNQTASTVTVLDSASWPSARELGLDESQFKALQLALINEFAVIQGPPGTGKTYIGLQVISWVLLSKGKGACRENRKLSDNRTEEMDRKYPKEHLSCLKYGTRDSFMQRSNEIMDLVF